MWKYVWVSQKLGSICSQPARGGSCDDKLAAFYSRTLEVKKNTMKSDNFQGWHTMLNPAELNEGVELQKCPSPNCVVKLWPAGQIQSTCYFVWPASQHQITTPRDCTTHVHTTTTNPRMLKSGQETIWRIIYWFNWLMEKVAVENEMRGLQIIPKRGVRFLLTFHLFWSVFFAHWKFDFECEQY